MKILFVSTVDHNPGDDFIRWGQIHLLEDALDSFDFDVMHKHDPRTAYEGFTKRESDPHRFIAPLLFRSFSALTSRRDLLAEADVVVFAGTPFVWSQKTWLLPSTTANAEWNGATWNRLFKEFPEKPVLNIAAGTSVQAVEPEGVILRRRRLAAFLLQAARRARLTTARDRATACVLSTLGVDVPCLPCTSLWASTGMGMAPEPPKYIAVNFMPHGTHPARGKSTEPEAWRTTFTHVVSALSREHQLCFLCHSTEEYEAALEYFPDYDVFYSSDSRELLKRYGRAYYTVSNRIHGAGGAASFGRPALGIGNDSRISLLGELGLPYLSTSATAKDILSACSDIESRYDSYCTSLREVRERGEAAYLDLIGAALS